MKKRKRKEIGENEMRGRKWEIDKRNKMTSEPEEER